MRLLFFLLFSLFTVAEAMPEIILAFDEHEYAVELADSAAAQALLQRLPITLTMVDLNDNEKYGDLETPLPTKAQSVGSVQTGDIMLFTPTCLVLFYKNFRTGYRYTPLGRVKNAGNLSAALGSGDVTVTLRAGS